MTKEINELEKQFFSDGHKLGINLSNAGNRSYTLFPAVKKLFASVDEFNDTFLNFIESHHQKTECRKGCEWCCHQPVYALSYELEFLKNYIAENFSAEKQTEIKKRAEQKRKKLEGLEKEDLLNSKFPCPLLENGSCIVYEARPVACRIYLSTSLKTCLNYFNNPEDQTNFPALLSFPMRAGKLMNEGFKSALKTNGIKAEEYSIEEKL